MDSDFAKQKAVMVTQFAKEKALIQADCDIKLANAASAMERQHESLMNLMNQVCKYELWS